MQVRRSVLLAKVHGHNMKTSSPEILHFTKQDGEPAVAKKET